MGVVRFVAGPLYTALALAWRHLCTVLARTPWSAFAFPGADIDTFFTASRLISLRTYLSTTPNPNDTVSPPLDEIPIPYPHPLHNRRFAAFFFRSTDASATIPLPPVSLVVYLDDILSSRGHDPPGVELHRSNRTVVREGIVNVARSQVPDLIVNVSFTAHSFPALRMQHIP